MATNVGDLYVNLKLDIKDLKKSIDKSQKEFKRVEKNTKKINTSLTTMGNNAVRAIRKLESLAVAIYAVNKAMNSTVVVGIKLNKMYEDQALGIAALTSAKTKMYDESGKELNSYEKFQAAQLMTLDTMDQIKEAALKTPASMQEMLGFYQQTIGHAISANGYFGKSMKEVNDNVILFTQRMSSLGSAVGMEMPKINEEIRSLMSGNASTDSLLAGMLFGSPTNANKAVKAAKQNVNGLSDLLLKALEPFKNVEGVMTYTKAMNQLKASMDDIRKSGTAYLFDDIKDAAISMTKYLKDNFKPIVEYILKAYDKMYVLLAADIGSVEILSKSMSGVWDSVKEIMGDLGTVMYDLSKILGLSEEWEDSLSFSEKTLWNITKFSNYFLIGVETVRLALIGVQRVMYNISQLWQSITTGATDAYNNALPRKELYDKMLADVKNGMSMAEASKKYREELQKTIPTLTKSQELYADAELSVRKITELSERNTKKFHDDYELKKKQIALDRKNRREEKDNAKKALAERFKNLTVKMHGGTPEEAGVKTAKSFTKGMKKGFKKFKPSISIEDINKSLEDTSNRFANSFSSAFEGILGGDLFSAFGSFFNNISIQFAKPFIEDLSESLSGMLNNIVEGLGDFGSAILGGLIAFGTKLISKLLQSGKEYTSEEWQKQVGATSSPESESIVKLLESMDWSMTRDLTYSKGIYDNMKALVVQTGKAAVGLSGSYDFTSKDAYTPGAIGGLWGGEDIKTLFTGMELQLKSFNDIIAQTVQTTQTTKTSWFGLKKKTTQNTSTNAVDSEIQKAINAAYRFGADAIMEAGKALGVLNAESIVNSFTGAMHTLNFEGKSTAEIEAMISGAISSDLDTLASQLFGWVEKYAKPDEGLMQAAGRIVYEMELVTKGFTDLGATMSATGRLAVEVSQEFIKASGGLDNALKNMSGFIDNFYSDVEKQSLLAKKLSATGLFGGSEAAYKAEVQRLVSLTSIGNISAAKQLAELLSLQNDYRAYFDNLNEMMKASAELANELASEIAAQNREAEAAYKEAMERIKKIREQAAKELLDFEMSLIKRNAEEITAVYKKKLDDELALAKASLTFHKSILSKIQDAYTGSLSYLNSLEKSAYLGNLAKSQLEQGDTQSYFDSLYKQLEYDKKMSTTKEDYALKFEGYINKLRGAEEPTTLTDVNDTLGEILVQNKKLETAISKSSYQKAY